MRKVLIVLFLLCGLLAGGAHWAVNSTWISVRIARWMITSSLSGARVTELLVGRQQCDRFGRFRWDNIRVGVEYKGKTARVVASNVMMAGLPSMLGGRSRLVFVVTGAEVSFPPGEAKNIKVDLSVSFERRKLTLMQGSVTVSDVQWDKIKARQVAFFLSGDLRALEFKDIHASAYGGSIIGSARFFPERQEYSADITADGIEMAKLAEVNEQVASQIAGRARGHVRLAGRGADLSSLESDWSMFDGAKVNASLLSALAQYIPQSQEKKRLEALIKKGGQLPVEVLSFQVRSDTPRHLGGEVKLKSREVNLELNLTNDINTDGTLLSLLEYWKTYFK